MEFYEKQLGYVHVDGKRLRRGFTTGTAAASAARAAAHYLIHGEKEDFVDISLFSGKQLKIIISKCYLQGLNTAVAVVEKFAGDDKDVTAGCKVGAKVTLLESKSIEIAGGEGVGVATRKGLKIPPGQSAINPKPLELIERSVRSVIGDRGAKIEIFVENGEYLAEKTFNPRLGIKGGISILGTTGIVEPMSEDAFKKSLREELMVKKSKALAFTFGHMGEKSLMALGVSEDKICISSNFVGYMLREGAGLGVREVLFAGHIGKLVKLSGGIFNTHSHIADAKNEIIVSNLALLHAPYELLQKVMNSLTVEESLEFIYEAGYAEVFSVLANKAAERATLHCYHETKVEVMMLDLKDNIICQSAGAGDLIKKLKKE